MDSLDKIIEDMEDDIAYDIYQVGRRAGDDNTDTNPEG